MNRILQVQKRLTADVLILDDPIDLYYLTGLIVSVGRLAIYPDSSCLFVDERYIEQAKIKAPCEVQLREGLQKYLQKAQEIAFDSAFLSFDSYQALEKNFPGKKWIPIAKPLKELRAIKDKNEIKALKKAAHLTEMGYRYLLDLLKEGITEEQLALEFEMYCRNHGASRLSFQPIIAFGENSAFPHYRAGKVPLKKDQIILFDLGAVVDEYYGDMTRVVFFGRPNLQLESDYRLLQEVQARVIASIRVGICFKELDQIARDALREKKVADLFTHGLSHGIGLQCHEYPLLKISGGDRDLRLEAGMTFTVEPGLYRPGLGGVRYEDTVLVTEKGAENFYTAENLR